MTPNTVPVHCPLCGEEIDRQVPPAKSNSLTEGSPRLPDHIRRRCDPVKAWRKEHLGHELGIDGRRVENGETLASSRVQTNGQAQPRYPPGHELAGCFMPADEAETPDTQTDDARDEVPEGVEA